jgi:hypothetical protein
MGILEDSVLTEEWYRMIMNTLMRIPASDLEQILVSLDRVIVMDSGYSARDLVASGTGHVGFQRRFLLGLFLLVPGVHPVLLG